jgi:sugar phosphate permease
MEATLRRRPTRVRYTVLWLTVLVYMITYMDRVVISAAAPFIQDEFELSSQTLGWILGAFQISYALFQIPGGWLGDRFGPRFALTLVVSWWSVFTAATALTWNATSMIVCRVLFGMGEAGAFPIATRSLSRWMLPSERGLAQGLTHAGSRLGGAITPIFVVALIGALGWRAPFFIFALIGLVWAAVWWWYYRNTPAEHKGVDEVERTLIQEAIGERAAPTKQSTMWKRILTSPQMWLLCCLYFCYGWGIVTFLQWFPTYLYDERGFELAAMGIAASLPLAAGVCGDLAGGWLSDAVLKRTGRITFSRRIIMVIGFLIAAVAVYLAAMTADPIVAVAWFCLAYFGLELVVGVAWAIPLDIGGQSAGSVSALMNTFGNLAGAVAAVATGYIVAESGWETAFMVISALAVVGAFLAMRIDASKEIV